MDAADVAPDAGDAPDRLPLAEPGFSQKGDPLPLSLRLRVPTTTRYLPRPVDVSHFGPSKLGEPNTSNVSRLYLESLVCLKEKFHTFDSRSLPFV